MFVTNLYHAIKGVLFHDVKYTFYALNESGIES